MIAELFAIVAPIFVCAGLGFGWAKSKRAWDTGFVTTLTYYIGTPCLVFATLTGTPLEAAAFSQMAGAAVVALAGFLIVSSAVLLIARLPFRPYLPSLIFPNAGNMGLPLCLFAFGDVGLALGIAYFTITSVSNFTLGVWISSGSGSAGGLLRTPLIYAVLAALAFMVWEIDVPRWLSNTTHLIGGLTIPLILITLGVSLAQLKVANVTRAVAFSLLRLGMGIGVGFGVALLFGLEGMERGIMILQSSMPVAVFNYLFAQRYDNSPADVAGMVVVSTTLSFATLPLLLLLVL